MIFYKNILVGSGHELVKVSFGKITPSGNQTSTPLFTLPANKQSFD
jgi:hypothetical protein